MILTQREIASMLDVCGILDAGLDLAIADMPGANRLTLLAAPELERLMIGECIRHALTGAKARGVNRKGAIPSKRSRTRLPQRPAPRHCAPHIER